jgi:hypothetical protein
MDEIFIADQRFANALQTGGAARPDAVNFRESPFSNITPAALARSMSQLVQKKGGPYEPP